VKSAIVKMLVLLSLVITLSCSWVPQYQRNKQGKIERQCEVPIFYVLRNMEGKNFEPIIDAADYWNVALRKRVFIYGGEYVEDVTEASAHLLVISQLEVIPDNACGWAHTITKANGCVKSSVILLNQQCMKDVKWTETLARHEMGHILGLRNNDNPWHLMNGATMERHKYYVSTPTEPVDARESEINALKEIY